MSNRPIETWKDEDLLEFVLRDAIYRDTGRGLRSRTLAEEELLRRMKMKQVSAQA